MSSHILQCPQCNKQEQIYLNDGSINTYCQCGYHSKMSINEFIKTCKKDNNDTFKNITTIIKEAKEYLLNYFKEIKEKHISRLMDLMSKLESSYEESYNRNLDILTFLQILIDNYDGSKEMKKNILDNDIKIYQCKDSDNSNEYNIMTITDHTDSVRSLFRLKDGKVASCSWDGTIRIYDPSNDYHCDKVIERHSYGILSICELDNGTIVSCSDDKSIIIGDYTIKDAHKGIIYKVISLPNNRIASCSTDKTIKIWKSNPPYSDTPIKVLEGHRSIVGSLLYIKERDIMISGSADETLRLWNMSTYQCMTVIEEVECYSTNSLYQIDKDRVIVGGDNSFCIVNIDKCVIKRRTMIENDTYSGDSLGRVTCFLKLRDNKTIVCGCDEGIFCFYDMERDEYKNTKDCHEDRINALLLIDEHTFLSCSYDETIKVWKY